MGLLFIAPTGTEPTNLFDVCIFFFFGTPVTVPAQS
jgi:hypothetical protein